MIDAELMYILKSEIRLHIVLSLKESPKSPKELTSQQYYITHISSNLNDLVKKGYVQCLTPNKRKNKKFNLTYKSKNMLKMINDLTKV